MRSRAAGALMLAAAVGLVVHTALRPAATVAHAPPARHAGAAGGAPTAAGAHAAGGGASRPYVAATMVAATLAAVVMYGGRHGGGVRRSDERRHSDASKRRRRSEARPQLFVVSCYTRFDNLAHGPKGKEAKRSLYTFRFDANDGQMVLQSVSTEDVMNPAFSRVHPTRDIMYTCTESVAEPGKIDTWSVDHATGRLVKLGSVSAGGTSTCYLTIDKAAQNMLVVNYWDATVGVFGIDQCTGCLTEARSFYDSNQGRPMRASHDKHVNHSENDPNAQKERQADPHAHAVILDKTVGRIAFVPDLGMDVIRQFLYNPDEGNLKPAGMVKSGPEGRRALGPRYIEFHPELPFAYVVNELSSEVSVFAFDTEAATQMVERGASERPTLHLVQTVRTIPRAYPGDSNTCGRITVHRHGDFVLVSNRGHDSIAVFRIERVGENAGRLSTVGIFHTRGATPRHFQFDASGEWLVSANQDSDKVCVFRFDLATGQLEWTGNEYAVPSPNFVCNVPSRAPPAHA